MNMGNLRAFFSPAIALMNRMGYTRKFALLWLMSMAAIMVVVYSLFICLDKEILTSQRELQGLALIKPISQAVQAIQRHRGFSVAFLSGNEAMQNRRVAMEKEAAHAFGELEEKLPPGLKATEGWKNIKAGWEIGRAHV